MKVKNITKNYLASYMRLELENFENADRKKEEKFLEDLILSAKKIICSHNGLTEEEVNESDELAIAVCILCSEMYERRTMILDKDSSNKVFETILGLSDENLL